MISLIMCLALTAEVDFAKVNPDDREYIKYFTLHNISKDDRKDHVAALSFVLNSVSKGRHIQRPEPLDDDFTTLRIDLRHYQIKPSAWRWLESNYPYRSKNPFKPIRIRVDWFIFNAFKEPSFYSQLLDINNLSDYYKMVGYDPKIASKLHVQSRAVIVRGLIARNTQIVCREPTLTGGSMWSTHQVATTRDLLVLDDLYDEKQLLGSLPNGLLAYFVADRRGKRLNFSAPEVSAWKGGLVTCADSCVSCHRSGVMDFHDSIRDLLENNVKIMTLNSDMARLLESFGDDIGKHIERDQYRFRTAVGIATGLHADKVNEIYNRCVEKYNEPVYLRKAASELEMKEDMLKDICKQSSVGMLQLLRIHQIKRTDWENIARDFWQDD